MLPSRAMEVIEVFIDLNPQTGSFFDGWVKMRGMSNVASYYLAHSIEPNMIEWLKTSRAERIADLFSKKQLVIPGFSHELEGGSLQDEIAVKLVLNHLTIQEKDGKPHNVTIPDNLVRTWMAHEKFGKEFAGWCDEECGPAGSTTSPNTPLSKRKHPVAGSPDSAEKRARHTKALCSLQDLDKLPPPLVDFPMVSVRCKPLLRCQIRPNSVVHIINQGECEVQLLPGTLITGFGKTSWENRKPDSPAEADEGKKILFSLESSEQKVLYEGRLTTLLQVVNDQRPKSQTHPSPIMTSHRGLTDHRGPSA